MWNFSGWAKYLVVNRFFNGCIGTKLVLFFRKAIRIGAKWMVKRFFGYFRPILGDIFIGSMLGVYIGGYIPSLLIG